MRVKLNKRYLIYIGIAIVLILILVFITHEINRSAEGSISRATPIGKPSQSTSVINTPEPIKFKKTINAYISFSYPSTLTVAKSSALASNDVAKFTFTNSGSNQSDYEQLIIDISKLPSGQINNDSDYLYRKLNPTIYSNTSSILNGQTFYLSKDLNAAGFSEVVFSVNNHLVASVALTATSYNSQLPVIMTDILSSWYWQ